MSKEKLAELANAPDFDLTYWLAETPVEEVRETFLLAAIKDGTPDPILEELAGALEKSCNSVCELIDNSRGVDGLHLNGDVADWDDLRGGGRDEGWLVEFDEALDVLQKYQQSKVQP